ncbi:glycosyltransferase family 4 protein, partial [Streptomyces sp. SID5614]|nr:glycosyltransferase family 4 protein [Streptomyces sp. SID5614]
MSRDIFIVSNSTDELGGVTAWMHQTARLFAEQGHRVHTVGIHASDLKMALPRQPDHPVTALYPAHPPTP